MDLVTVKSKFQVVIPRSVRERVHLDVGDLLEAGVEDGKITLTPKTAVDRHLAEGLADLAAGRTHGPYRTARAAVAALNASANRKTKPRRP
jgi:AbrB family looped-hinge helix DNA binding protein